MAEQVFKQDAELRWYEQEVTAAIHSEIGRRIARAAIVLTRYARRQVSRVGPGHSKAGEFPYKKTGHLRRNITYEIYPNEMGGRWGTNVLYGKFLELGTRGPGRRRMVPRPWITRTTAETMHKIKRILGGRL